MAEVTRTISSDKAKSIRELGIIIKISQNIIKTLNYQKVLQIISDGMSELLDIETAAIYTIESEEELLLSATTPPLDPKIPYDLRKIFLNDHPHVKKAILERKSILLPDTENAKLTQAEREVVNIRKLRSLLYLPFIQEDEVLGILILGTCNKSRTYSEQEIELGQAVANQLSVAIQNARFHVDLEKYKDNLEKLVAERTKELENANKELKNINTELQTKNELVITQRDEIEDALDKLKSLKMQLIQSEKMASLGVLTAGVAHEINNPLNFIMGAYLSLEEILKSDKPPDKNDISVLLSGFKTGIDRTSKIIEGLNQFSRDSNKLNEVCDIHTILDQCLLMLNHQLNDKITINKLYSKDKLIINGNVGRLHQVFTNIIVNSIQSICDEGIIKIATKRVNNSVLIEISDTGCGIKKENLKKITDPFFTTKDPNEGTGLGLSIVYSIIQDHKGELEFTSDIKTGTTAHITLPAGG